MVDQHRQHGGGCGSKTGSDLTSAISVDLLKEIFLRLPLGRDIIRCSSVCKRWLSLISDSDRQFIHIFTQYHRRHNHIQHSIFFRYSPEVSQPFHHLRLANKSSLITASSDDHLDFLPKWPDVAIRASCQDLLLVSSTSDDAIGEEDFYICNPFTRQWHSLPKANCFHRKNTLTTYGLIREAGSDSAVSRFKVVLINCLFRFPNSYLFYSSAFCSETWRWTQRIVSLPNTLPRQVIGLCSEDIVTDVVVREGVLYWLEGDELEFKALASVEFVFCPSYIPKEILLPVRARLISLPGGFSHCVRSKDIVCLGVVWGRVRMAQLVGVNQASLVLKVWELADSDDWVVVHSNITLLQREGIVLSLLAFHPNDSNVIFLLRDREICELKIEEGGFQQIGKLPGDETLEEIKKRFSQYLKVFTLEHPLWPTIIPQLQFFQSSEA